MPTCQDMDLVAGPLGISIGDTVEILDTLVNHGLLFL